MFKKTGFKKIVLSCTLVITMVIGGVSVGYGGCGAGVLTPLDKAVKESLGITESQEKVCEVCEDKVLRLIKDSWWINLLNRSIAFRMVAGYMLVGHEDCGK